MSFWMNFIFHGARVGGLRERRQLELEMGRLGHLDHCPDSQSGKAEIDREKHLLKSVHLRYITLLLLYNFGPLLNDVTFK